MKVKVLLILFCLSFQIYADESICFDKHSSYSTSPPKGWVEDFKRGKALGMCVIYYLKGETYDTSPAIIYPNLVGMKESGKKAVEANITLNTKKLLSRNASMKVIKKKSIKNTQGLHFEIRHFSNGPAPQEFEAVGYHGTKEAVLLAVYSTRSKKNFDKYLKAHKEFLMAIKPLPKLIIKPDFK